MVPDIKKLITGFLLMSLVAASLSLFFSKSQIFSPPPLAELTAPLPENAFVPQTPSPTSSSLSSAPTEKLTDTSNLTRRLGNLLAQEVIRVNDAAGTLDGPPKGLLAPGRATLNDIIQNNLADAKVLRAALPDFSGKPSSNALALVHNPSVEDFSRYTQEVVGILRRTIINKEFDALLQKSASVESIYAGVTAYSNAAQSLESLPVPESLAAFHSRMLTLVENRKKMAELALGYPDDPLKSLAAIEQAKKEAEGILSGDAENLLRETSRLRLSLLLPRQKDLFARLLGIEQAFAQDPSEWMNAEGISDFGTDDLGDLEGIDDFGGDMGSTVPVKDKELESIAQRTESAAKKLTKAQVISNTKNWLKRLWEWAQKGLLQELKNQIIHMLEQQIVNWINGGGKPQFVTDWKGFLSDAFNNAAGAAIEDLLPELCYPFSLHANLRIVLRAPSIPVYTGCTLNQVITNVKNFYSDFKSGGWLQYSVTFQPTGNFYGIMIEGHDKLTRAGAEAAEAAANKALAGKGFLSTEVCPNTGKPPFASTAEAEAAGYYVEKSGCPDGKQPIVKTPGTVLADTLTKGLSLPSELIVNADDIAGLVATVADAALTRLITVGISSVSGQPTGSGITEVHYGAGGGGATVNCSNLTDKALQECTLQNQIAECNSGRKSGPSCATARKQLEDLQSAKYGVTGIITDSRKSSGAENVKVTSDTAGAPPGSKNPAPPKLPNAKVDLSSVTFAGVRQNYTQARNDGSGPAERAVDGSTYSFSSTFGSSPSWWELTLPAPEYLDEVSILTHETYPMSYGNVLILFEEGTNAQYRLTLPQPLVNYQVNLTSVKATDVSGREVPTPPYQIKVAKVRLESDLLMLKEVQLYRHLAPIVDASRVPSTLPLPAATNFDPRIAGWVSATTFPYYNRMEVLTDQSLIQVSIENSLHVRVPPSSTNPLRYTLPAGSYFFSYSVEAGGMKSAPVTRSVTVQAQ